MGFHRVIHKVLNFSLDESAAKRQIFLVKLQEVFRANWTFASHAYTEIYIKEAFIILQNAHEKITDDSTGNYKRKTCHLDLLNGIVKFSPDFYRESETETAKNKSYSSIGETENCEKKNPTKLSINCSTKAR